MLWLLVVQQMKIIIMVHDYQVIIIFVMFITHAHMQGVKRAIDCVIIVVMSTKMPYLEHLNDSCQTYRRRQCLPKLAIHNMRKL